MFRAIAPVKDEGKLLNNTSSKTNVDEEEPGNLDETIANKADPGDLEPEEELVNRQHLEAQSGAVQLPKQSQKNCFVKKEPLPDEEEDKD